MLLVVYSYFVGMFSATRTEVEAEMASPQAAVISMRTYLQSAVADALEWTAHLPGKIRLRMKLPTRATTIGQCSILLVAGAVPTVHKE